MGDPRRFRIVVCRGPECGERRGSAQVHDAFRAEIAARGLEACAELAWQSCFGRCTQGPNVLVRELVAEPPTGLGTGFASMPGPRGVTALYNRVDVDRAGRVVEQHVVGGQIVREYVERPSFLQSSPARTQKDS